MTSRVAHFRFQLLLAAIAAVCLLEGCMMVPVGLSQYQRRPVGAAEAQRRAPDRPEPAVDDNTQPEREKVILAAVEEFLKRTEDYDRARGAGQATGSPTATNLRVGATAPRPVKAGRIETQAFAHREGPPVPLDASGRLISYDRDSGFQHLGHRREAPPTAVANTHVALADRELPKSTLALPVVQSVSIREAVKPVVEPEESTASSTSNQPLDVKSDDTAVSADRFLEQLEAQAHKANDFDSSWRLLLVRVAINRITEPLEATSGLSAEVQRILSGLIRLIVSARAAARNPLLIGEEALQAADDFRLLLADRADPEVSAVAMCRKVVTFGVYEEMDSEEFVAGRSMQTIVYSEIRNLRSEQTADGQFRTQLGTRLEVLTADGESMWQHEEPEIEDLCRRRRTDFFIAQRIKLPATLGARDYILKVFAEDKLSGKANEASYRFTMHAPLSFATNH